MKPARLKNAIRHEVEALMSQAEKFSRKKKHLQAIQCLESGLALIPDPKISYWETTLVKLNLAAELMSLEKFDEALVVLDQAGEVSGVIGLPVFHISRGKCLFVAGNLERAAQGFIAAKNNVTPHSNWKEFFLECDAAEAIELIDTN